MMIKKILIVFSLFCIGNLYSQSKIMFNYDPAGNQVLRSYIYISGRTNQTYKDEKSVTTADYKKTDAYAEVLYYPNPVKEELYVQWQNLPTQTLTHVVLIDSNGRTLWQKQNLENQTQSTVPFSGLPAGLYLLQLNYTTGEPKVLKIIKE